MNDKISKDFLVDILSLAKQMYQKSIKEIEETFEQQKSNIAVSMLKSITSGLEHYNKLELKNEVGMLNYIYFSFLRTSIIFNNSDYRLDFYDDRNRICLIECTEKWNFDFIFSHLKHIYNKLKEKFDSQTKVPGYELDDIIYNLAEEYRKLADKKIVLVMQFIIEQNGNILFGEKKIKFFTGDYFDWAILIFEYNQEDIKAILAKG